jgi:hypothetical protein
MGLIVIEQSVPALHAVSKCDIAYYEEGLSRTALSEFVAYNVTYMKPSQT